MTKAFSPCRGVDLRTAFLSNPLGIDAQRPRLSWVVKDHRPGARQGAYRVCAASSLEKLQAGDADVWDSGKMDSSEQTHLSMLAPLTSRQRVFWNVKLWDADGLAGEVSEAAYFETGLLDAFDWTAHWIATPLRGTGQTMVAVPALRRTFTLPASPVSARLYVTALGLHEAHLNGKPVSEDYFRPGWTDYFERVQYQTYDVTSHLRAGENAIAVLLGDGWWCGRVGHLERGLAWGERPALLAQIEVTCADGSLHRIVSDTDWTWKRSAIIGADFLTGEEYDARAETPLWNDVGSSSDGWLPVEAIAPRHGKLVAQRNEPVQCVRQIEPIADPKPISAGWDRDGWVYDFGQNLVGVVRLRVKGPAGATIKLRFGEMLNPDGSLYTANMRSARVTDFYTLLGDATAETWTPRFTFHGFRYAELSIAHTHVSDEAVVKLEVGQRGNLTALVLMSGTRETGSFSCDNALINKLQQNIQWGQRGNFLEVPTDCPQRDERLGWTGDAQVFADTAAFNFDVAAFFSKWCDDLDDAQHDAGEIPFFVPEIVNVKDDAGPGWSDARVQIPWSMYKAYGDRALLERHYEPMKRWAVYIEQSAVNGVRCGEDFKGFKGFGDWLNLEGGAPHDLIGTAYFAHAMATMRDIAGVLGHDEDAVRFARARETAVAAFNLEFVSPAGRLASPTQTAHLMALGFDMLPEAVRPVVFAELIKLLERKDWHLATGFLGTPLMCPVLTRFGRIDLAYKVLMQVTYPGWLFPVVNGATTMWERWNSWTPDAGFGDVSMNSFNHYAYGAVGKWIYTNIGGIDLDESRPPERRLIISPRPGGGIRTAEARLLSRRGEIRTQWTLKETTEGDELVLNAHVPPNTTAHVHLPDGSTHQAAAGDHLFRSLV